MIWAGITDHYEEDVWVNPYTLEQSGMTFWEPGRPNGGVARNCARTYLGIHILFKTSTSNPFLCAADFFLQLGSCKEAVR